MLLIAILLILNGYTFFKYFEYSIRYGHCTEVNYIYKEDVTDLVKGLTFVKRNEMIHLFNKSGVNYTIDSLNNTIRFQLLTIQFGEDGFINSIQQ
jgi:hypothetical protein